MENWAKIEDEKYSWLYENNYPAGNPMRLVTKFNIEPSNSCLDLGCGRAVLSTFFEQYTGVDVSKFIIEENRKTKNGSYHHRSLNDLSYFTGTKFDVVICSDVLEHIPPQHIQSVMSNIAQLKAKRFYFAISTRASGHLDRDGNNLHLGIFPYQIWRLILVNYLRIIEEENTHDLYLVCCSGKAIL